MKQYFFSALTFFGLMANTYADFEIKEDTAQYKNADYSTAIRVERGITIERALEIAEQDPRIDYFFYLKDSCMVLEMEGTSLCSNDLLGLITRENYVYDDGSLGSGLCRIFYKGDAVFFQDIDTLWLGTAPGLADTYVRVGR